MTNRMNVKEAPRRVESLPVVKSVFLGWLPDFRQEPGYFACLITHGVTDSDKGHQYQVHIMWAGKLDGRWRLVTSAVELTRSEALAQFEQYEKLAVWPEGE